MQRPGRHPMQIYLETADPGLLAREGKESTALIRELVELVPGPVAVEVTAFGTEEIVEEARMLSSLHERVLVRVPCVPAGIPAMAALADQRIAVFVEMDDAGGDGLTLVSAIMTMLDQFDLKSGVIAGSVRTVGQVAEVARMGADGVALSLALLRELAEHPLSDSVRRERLDHWRQAQN